MYPVRMYTARNLAIIIMWIILGLGAFYVLTSAGADTAFAQSGGTQSPGGTSPSGGTQSPGGTAPMSNSGSLTNPLQSQTIREFILKIIDVILVFAIPIIVLYIMYAGFKFVTAGGDSGQISEAKKALMYAIIGGVIALGAKVIIEVIQGTVSALSV